MALVQLMSYGEQNRMVPIHETYEMIELPFNNRNDCVILKNADLGKLDHLIFTSDTIHNIDEFNNAIFNTQIELTIGNQIIFTNNLRLYTHFNPVIHVDNTFVIKIPDFFLLNIDLISLQYCEVKIKYINLNNNLFTEKSLTVKYTHLDIEPRRNRAQRSHNNFIQYITHSGEITQNSMMNTSPIESREMIKGYFIEGNIDNINDIELILNGVTRFKYNKIMINLYCKKITNKLLYLPFNNTHEYHNASVESMIGSANGDRIDNLRMRFGIDNTTNEIMSLYALNINNLSYESGFGFLQYHDGASRTLATSGINSRRITQSYVTHLNVTQLNITQNLNSITQSNVIQSTEWQIEYKLLTSENNICSITYDEIIGDYGTCIICNNNFDYNSIKRWLNSRNSCPMCRSGWTNMICYKNSIESTEPTQTTIPVPTTPRIPRIPIYSYNNM